MARFAETMLNVYVFVGFHFFMFFVNCMTFNSLFDSFLDALGLLVLSFFLGPGAMLEKYQFFKVGQGDTRIKRMQLGEGKRSVNGALTNDHQTTNGR